jgi:hypothetical protein
MIDAMARPREPRSCRVRTTADLERIFSPSLSEPLGTTDADASLDWPLTPGRHVISARDTRGRRASAEIVVK